VFHPEGTVIDTFPSALVTTILPDDGLVADVLLVVDDAIVVDVLLVVDDCVAVDDLLQPASWSMIVKNNTRVKKPDIIFLSYFIYNLSLK
jgi:hypothetical protein